jgi:hypothetical protein
MILPAETIEVEGIVFREDSPFVGYRTFRAVPADDSLGVVIYQGVWWYVVMPDGRRERFSTIEDAVKCAARRSA